jgi:hypothetical protein
MIPSIGDLKAKYPEIYARTMEECRIRSALADAVPDYTHHIDLDRKNNSQKNLVKCRPSIHHQIHTELWRQSVNAGLFEPRIYIQPGGRRRAHSLLSILIKRGKITFDRSSLTYNFSHFDAERQGVPQ